MLSLVDIFLCQPLFCQDSLSFSNSGNLSALMNGLFGISEDRLHYSFFSDFLNNNRQEEIPTIQIMLQPDEVMLEYCLSDTTLTFFIISRSVFSVYQQNVDQNFWIKMREYRKKIRLADITDQASLSHILYLRLVAPVKEMIRGKRRLIIIPGKDLLGIPFEALIVDEYNTGKIPRYNRYHYLIHDFEITYHYSARLWIEMRTEGTAAAEIAKNNPKIDFTGFSPGNYQNPLITSLPYARDELSSIGVLFKQKGMSFCLMSEQNSKENLFKELAGRSRIVHLATHGHSISGNPESAGIIFWDCKSDPEPEVQEDGILSYNEIGSLKLQADLIVLNSCSSAAISLKSNARVEALPIGFLMAGAKNILSTLWEVTDFMAYHFVADFYKKWLSGKTFSQALREVKLELIEQRETSLPTLWASYVLIGN